MKNGELSRRMFLGAGGAFALLNGGCAFRAPAGLFGGGAAKVRFGVISDVHIREPGDERHLLDALRFFRERGADGVMVAGDIADQGRISQLKIFADAWYSVFPDDRGLGGQKVEKLFIYGNHDIWGATNDPELAKRRDGIGYDDARPARVWEELFHEPYSDFWIKNVKGYSFIGGHWTKKDNFDGLDAFLRAHEKELDPSKPFFYTQHAHPKDTCYGAWAWGHDNGESTRALSRFPNAVAFSGHSHYTLTDDRSIWQGAFTSINTSSMKYSSRDYSLRDNIAGINSCGYQGEKGRPKPHPRVYVGRWQDADMGGSRDVNLMQGRQGMLVSVYDDSVTIERREFFTGHSLGDDWVIPLPVEAGKKPYAYDAQARRKVAPEFGADAKVAVSFVEDENKDIGRAVQIDCPRAEDRGGCRVFDYEVTATLVEDDVDIVQVQRRFIAPDFFLPPERRIPSCRFRLALADLKLKGRYRFGVTPVESFGKKGRTIWSELVGV